MLAAVGIESPPLSRAERLFLGLTMASGLAITPLLSGAVTLGSVACAAAAGAAFACTMLFLVAGTAASGHLLGGLLPHVDAPDGPADPLLVGNHDGRHRARSTY